MFNQTTKKMTREEYLEANDNHYIELIVEGKISVTEYAKARVKAEKCEKPDQMFNVFLGLTNLWGPIQKKAIEIQDNKELYTYHSSMIN